MNKHSFAIDQHLWIYCNVLRDYKIEKELGELLPCREDRVRAERL